MIAQSETDCQYIPFKSCQTSLVFLKPPVSLLGVCGTLLILHGFCLKRDMHMVHNEAHFCMMCMNFSSLALTQAISNITSCSPFKNNNINRTTITFLKYKQPSKYIFDIKVDINKLINKQLSTFMDAVFHSRQTYSTVNTQTKLILASSNNTSSGKCQLNDHKLKARIYLSLKNNIQTSQI